MSHENKTKEQLIAELSELRQRIVELETLQIQHKQVEEALKESENKYSTIVEKGNDGIAIAQHGKVKFANSTLLELFGFTLEETVEKPFIDFITPESRELVMERYKKRIAGEKIPNKYEIELYAKDGRKIPVEINASLIEYEGKPADLAIIRDITEHKLAVQALRKSEKKFRELSELLPQTIYETDIEGNLTFTNRIGFETTGYSQEDLDAGLSAFKLIVPEDHERLKENITRIKKGNDIGINEYTAQKKDGSRFPVVVHSNIIKDDEGNPVGVRGIMINIIERKKAEKEIFRAKEYLEKMFNSVTDSIFVIDMNRRFMTCNNATERIFGYKKEEIIGNSAELFYPTQQAFEEMAMNTIKEIKEKGYADGEIILRRKDGTNFPAYATASLLKETDGKPIGIVGTVRDITNRKQAEEKLKKYTENLENLVEERAKTLKESEERLKAILTGIGALITIQNKELDIIWANQPLRDLWGDVIGKKCYKAYKGLTEPCPDCTVEKVFKEGKTTVSERVSTLPDGSCINILVTSSPVLDSEGKIVAVVEVDKDITERKKLESQLKDYTENLEKIVEERTKKLKESEEKLNAILTGIADLITIQNRDLDIIWVNQPMKDLYGDIVGKKCYKVYKRLDEPCEDCYAEKVFNEGKTVISERESILPDGSLIQVFITSSPVRDAEGNIVAILEVEKDITEQKKLESQLIESEEKLKAILAGTGDLIGIHNKDLDVIWVSQSIKDSYGDIIGKKCYAAYKGLDKPCTECTVEQVFAEEKTMVSEQSHLLPDGSHRHVLLTSSPLRDAEGNIVAIVESAKDITERKQLETQLKDYTDNLEKRVAERTKALKESEEKLRALLRGIGDRITIQNKNLEITWINQPVKNIFGDITGQKCYEAYKGLTEPCSDCYAGIVFNEEKTLISERTDIRPDGRHINTLVTSSPVKDAEGNVVAIIEVTKDITERKKMEQQLKEYTENLEKIVDKRTKALKESEEKQKAILRGIGDRITIQNKDLDIIWANQVMKDIFGDITGQKCYEAYKGLTERCPDCTVEKVFKEEKTVVSEGIVISPEGEHSNILTTSSPVRDTEGNIAAVVEVVKDITERKKAEKKIKEYTENLEKLVEERTLDLKVSEEHYRGLYESSIDGIASLDMDGNIKECNQAYANMLGYTKDDLYNLTYQDLTPDRWYDMETKIITKQILPKGYSNVYEKEHIKKDGTIFPVSVRGWLIKDKEITPTGMWSIVRDISEQKKMERQLKKYTEDLEASEERYRGLYESSLDGIVFLDLEGNILECNQAFADMLEYTKKQLYNSNYRELFPSKLFDYVAKTLSDQMFTSGYSDELETEAIKKDGTIISVSVKAWRIKDKENKPIGTWTIVRDITEQKKLESQLKNYAENLEKLVEKRTEKLRESEERYRGLYKSSADGIFSADSERNIIECNQAFADMLGYTKEELYELNFGDLTPRKWFDLVNGRIRTQLLARGYSEEYEQEALKQDGSIIPISVRVWWVKDKENRPIGLWGIIRNITLRKRAEGKIKEYTENLEKLIEERTLELKELERRYSK